MDLTLEQNVYYFTKYIANAVVGNIIIIKLGKISVIG